MRLALFACLALMGPGCTAKTGVPPPAGFVRVSAGTFTMGTGSEAPELEDERPAHSVTISRDYFMQIHEVTRGEFHALLGAAPEPFNPCDDRCPVERVNRYESIEYANAKSRAEGLEECYEVSGRTGKVGAGCGEHFGCGPGLLWPEWETEGFEVTSVRFKGLACTGYRLPTEAEWEYAARAGMTSAEHAQALDRNAWQEGNAERIQPVGQKAANPWGLHDMLGNVWEATHDRYGPYTAEAVTDPLGPEVGEKYVDRGGSYMNAPSRVTPTARIEGLPVGRNANCGFRLARSAG